MDERKDHLWKVAQEAEDRIDDLMKAGSNPVGLDVGTSKVVAAKRKGKEVHRARVPEEVTALRERLERLRLEQSDNPSVLAAIDRVSAALDQLTIALVRDMLGADDGRRPRRR